MSWLGIYIRHVYLGVIGSLERERLIAGVVDPTYMASMRRISQFHVLMILVSAAPATRGEPAVLPPIMCWLRVARLAKIEFSIDVRHSEGVFLVAHS